MFAGKRLLYFSVYMEKPMRPSRPIYSRSNIIINEDVFLFKAPAVYFRFQAAGWPHSMVPLLRLGLFFLINLSM